ncbi:MAG: caspase family protein [Betaproteobacteria bacterium]|nr:caspase family protein [Betaproteobacteria bacterium]
MADDDELSRSDLLSLVENARELSSEIDYGDLVAAILTRAGNLTSSESGSVILHDAERDGMYFAAATGPKAQDVLTQFGEFGPDRVPMGSIAGRVYKTGESLIERSVVRGTDHFKGVDQQTNYSTKSMICVPLAIESLRSGVVQLLNKASGDYTSRDLRLLEHFAGHAAIAIRNARHIRDLLAHKGLFTSAAHRRKTGDLLGELAAPAHHERMTVMFADMRGFSRLSQTLGDPKEIAGHLNEFLTLLAAQVVKFDGFVNKFLGDGVLALFRGKTGTEERSLRCAFSIIAGFVDLRNQWNRKRNEDLGFLDIGFGIATGDVIIGSIGGGQIKDFTALGNVVNLAAAFEQDARGGKRILVDQNTYYVARDIVAEVDDPQTYDMRKSDQPMGVVYKRYHVRRLRPAAGEAVVTVKSRKTHPDVAKGLGAYYQNSWAIVVGVDTYQSPSVARLSYAVADAEAVAEALPRAGFPAERIELLVNEKATKDGILRSILGKVETTQREDRLLVFFALHGQVLKHRKGEEGYLLPYDADPANLPLSSLPMVDFVRHGKSLPAKHILFVLDSCFSGYAAKRDAAPSGVEMDLTGLTQEPVVQLLTAGTGNQKAVEDGGHGIFTRSFLKGLEGFADPDGAGLTALKLADYILKRVLAESDNRQTPQYAKLDGEGEFLFLPPRAQA